MKIAIVGKLRSGKSIVSEEILQLKNTALIEFSGALQEVVSILYPNNKGKKDREKLIKVGQHLRKMDKDIWVNIVKYKIQNCESGNIVVVGVRQLNEYEMLKEQGFVFIKVVADEKIRIERCKDQGDIFSSEILNDPTETVLDEFKCDYEIINDSSIEDLKRKVKEVLISILLNEFSEKAKRSLLKFIKEVH